MESSGAVAISSGHICRNSTLSCFECVGLGRLSLKVPPAASPRRSQPLRVRSMHLPHINASVVTQDWWDELILKSEVPVLVEFFANWCGPCRMVHQMIDEIVEDYAPTIKCFLLNMDTDLDISEHYVVKAVPVVLLFKNGQRCEYVVGTMPKYSYVAAIQRVLDS